MLIKNYQTNINKTLNNTDISKDTNTIHSFNWIKYPTSDLSVFDIYNNEDIIKLIEEQKKFVKKEADLYFKYGWLSKMSYEQTMKQYDNLFYLNGYFYLQSDVKEYIAKNIRISWATEFDIYKQQPQVIKINHLSEIKQPQEIYEISRQAIRNITGYNPYFIPTVRKWPTTYVERQDKLIEDEHKLVLVLWSRQIGKCIISSQRVKLASWEYKICKNLEYNDILLGSNYQPIKITQLIKNKTKPSYKITFDNWHEEIYSEEHRIPTDKNFNPINWWDKNKETQLENYYTIKELFNIQWNNNFKVPFIFNTKKQDNEDITYEEALLYWYFLWNWTNNTNTITWNHSRLLTLSEFKITKNIHKNTFQYLVFWYKQKVNLKWLWLSKDKFIDQIIFKQKKYLQWAVLDWLLNTDWYLTVMKNNSPKIEYCSVSKQLIDDIFLLWLELWLVFKKRVKKIKSNFNTNNTYAYYLDIQDISTLKKIIDNTNLEDKLNFTKFSESIKLQLKNTNKCSRISTIPLSASNFITNTSRKNKKPWYNFQREKIENWTFTWINSYLKYSWHSIKNIEYIWEQEVVSIWVDSDDELFFTEWSLTHNSFSIAEKAVEESHIPNNDILVWAFRVASTDNIRKYIRKFIKNFSDWYFEEFKAERYFLNTKTGSKIYFRTLSEENEAVEAVRWMTLNTIIVDEAQLVTEYAYEEILRPTLATTAWKMILIWTPPRTTTWYFVEKIFQYKKWLLPKASYYEIKLQDQPFTDPDTREEMMSRQDEPRIQRERFCNLMTESEQLFKPTISKQYPSQSDNNHFYILTIDPARLWDRSWYIINQIWNWKVSTILSGFVPDSHKKDWTLQASFFKKLIQNYPNIIIWMDISWVWDWVYTIFKQAGLKINYTIRYTSWQVMSVKQTESTNYTVAKSILINTFLDFISEDQLEIIELTNKDLIEELSYIQEDQTRTWIISFKSRFYDDITNALMINLFIIKERKLLSKTPNQQITTLPSSNNELIDAIEWLWYSQQQYSSMW